MVTTVKIQEQTKDSLNRFKRRSESYDRVIQRLIDATEKKELSAALKQGYQEMSESQFNEFLEWDQIE